MRSHAVTRETNRIPKESKLDEKEKMIGEIMIQLKDKYVCNFYNHKYCFVKDDRHLPLSNISFSMWAQDIVSIKVFII